MKTYTSPLPLLISTAGLVIAACASESSSPFPSVSGQGGASVVGNGGASPSAGTGGTPLGSGEVVNEQQGGSGPLVPAQPVDEGPMLVVDASSGADADAPPPAGVCDFTPTANALTRQLRFDAITLTGLPALSHVRPEYESGITEVKFVPGTTDEFLLIRKSGPIYHFRLAGNAASLIAELTLGAGQVNDTEDCGLISLAFDPDFISNRFVYFGHCTLNGRTSKISRTTFTPNGELTNRQDILEIQAVGAGNSWHSMGSIGFDNDKNLWAVHGEFNTGQPAQELTSRLGKLLRVVPSREEAVGGSVPAPGNPGGAFHFALGLRSPWRAAFQPTTGNYVIADVAAGQTDWEEINVVTQAGTNLGWPNGTCNNGSIACWNSGLNTMSIADAADLSDTNVSRSGRAIWVTAPYADCGNDRYAGSLTGVFLLGDFFKGWVLGMTLNDAGAKTQDQYLGTLTTLTSFAQGPDGFLYATKFGAYHEGAEVDAVQGLYRVSLATP